MDLNALCTDAVRAVWPEPGHPAVTLDLALRHPTIGTDAERLRLALVNVLTNARQAVESVAGAPRGVRVSTAAVDDHRVRVAIRDDGPGISSEDLTRIFDPFFTTRPTGTGLGLALTRNIIEGLGGSIIVKSERGSGTEVLIELPATSPQA